MADARRYTEIQDALRRIGRSDVQVLLWTREKRMAVLVCHRAGIHMIPVRLADGWRGWVLVRGAGQRYQCDVPSRAGRNMRRPSIRSHTASPRTSSRSSRPIVSAITAQTCSGLRCRSRRVARS
jgi:hypothetical protein